MLKGGVIYPPKGTKHLEYLSLPQEEAQLGIAPADIPLPQVTVDNMPAGLQIDTVIAKFKFRMLENTSIAPNSLAGALEIQIQRPGIAWTPVIDMPAGAFLIPATTREEGTTIVGDRFPIATVNQSAIYTFQWQGAMAGFNFLNFNDIQMELNIFYT